MQRPESQTLFGLVIIVTVVAGTSLFMSLKNRLCDIDDVPPRPYEYQVEINSASWVEFANLPSVGKSVGQAIVAFRDANGDFQSVDELTQVKGIGDITLNKIRPYLFIKGGAADISGTAANDLKRNSIAGSGTPGDRVSQ